VLRDSISRYVGRSVGRSVGPSVGPSVRRSTVSVAVSPHATLVVDLVFQKKAVPDRNFMLISKMVTRF
jgi:hypothetical protein